MQKTGFFHQSHSIIQENPNSALQLVNLGIQQAQDIQLKEAEGFGRSIEGVIYDALGQFDKAAVAHQLALDLLADQDQGELDRAKTNWEKHITLTQQSN